MDWSNKHRKMLGRTLMLRIFSHLLLGLSAIPILAGADAAAPIGVGQPAPDFAVASLDGGRTIRLSDLRGHRILIFTWASW